MAKNPFSTQEYDLKDYKGIPSIYMICSTPRSGSTLLGSLLQSTDLMGIPIEYFHPTETVPSLCKRWNLQAPVKTQQYIGCLLEKRTTPNGIFGVKSHYDQMRYFIKQDSFLAFLRQVKVFIHITRRDILAQAVSYSIAHKTQSWSSLHTQEKDPSFDLDLINKALDDILAQNAHWEKFFALNNIPPIRLSYEDLIEGPGSICRKITQQMGVTNLPPITLSDTILKQQRTRLNQQWMEQFRKEKRIL